RPKRPEEYADRERTDEDGQFEGVGLHSRHRDHGCGEDRQSHVNAVERREETLDADIMLRDGVRLGLSTRFAAWHDGSFGLSSEEYRLQELWHICKSAASCR